MYGKDEWNQEKYGIKPQRSWRKLHLAIDEQQQIVTIDLTEKSVGDTSGLNVLLAQVDAFDTFIADGAYDGDPTYTQILQQQPNANIIIPTLKKRRCQCQCLAHAKSTYRCHQQPWSNGLAEADELWSSSTG